MAKKKRHDGSRIAAARKVSKDGPSKTIAASVPEALTKKLDKLALKEGWNRSQAVTEAIRLLLAKHK